jgi:hypothetical protein
MELLGDIPVPVPLSFFFNASTAPWGPRPPHFPVPLCPPQFSHGLTRDRTGAYEVRGRRLTTFFFISLYLRSDFVQFRTCCYAIFNMRVP